MLQLSLLAAFPGNGAEKAAGAARAGRASPLPLRQTAAASHDCGLAPPENKEKLKRNADSLAQECSKEMLDTRLVPGKRRDDLHF